MLFRVKTDFRANISAFNPWHPVVLFIFDLHQKRINAVVFTLDDSLSKDYGIIGNKR